MKKFVALLLAAMMLLAMVACGIMAAKSSATNFFIFLFPPFCFIYL